jgi:acetylornithine deacetylase/succinyl-diaminopimelate desuccinylase family protein
MREPVAAVLAELDAMEDQILETLATLVRIPSVTPKYPGLDYDEHVGGESRCNAELSKSFRDAGCEIDLWSEEPGRDNLVGVLKGSGGGRSLILNGHVDTVPPGDPATWRWGDPWSGRIEDGNLYGLGSVDMKAGLVAMGGVAQALTRAGVTLQGDLILESVVGEETMDHNAGVSATVKRGYRADAAIVTEPSGFSSKPVIAPCSPGTFWLRITVPGKATHVMVRGNLIWPGGAGERYGVNAIDKGYLIYESLKQLETEWGMHRNHPLFPAGHFTIGLNLLSGRPPGPPVPFIVPHECVMDYIVIYRPDDDPEQVKAEIIAHLDRTFDQDTWLSAHRPTLEWPHQWPAYETPVEHPIVSTLSAGHLAALGTTAKIQGFPAVDDATYLQQGGIPSISYGPGDVMMAHSVDEYVSCRDVIDACKVLAATVVDWCGVA